MAKPDFIAQLAQQASKLMSNGPEIQQDIEEKVQVLLQGGFSRLNMVSRDEFDAQVAVLNRTRSKLDALEKQLASLTEQLEQKS
ncbi:MAG: BMFP domain-containing protein YqiC [Zhongshania sp.]|jgi:BMFP domain-containing protein YqiC